MGDVTLTANSIWIKAGSLKSEKNEDTGVHTNKITFELLGNKNDRGYVFTPELAENKIFVVTGRLELFGPTPATQWTKLKSFAHAGDTSIIVGSASGWAVGDEIVIGPSFTSADEHEKLTITSISGSTVSFTPALQFNHYGANSKTIDNDYGTLDTRAAVGHLTRNIKFISGSDSGWGYTLHVYGYRDTFTNDDGDEVEVLRTGSVNLQGVEFYEGGQYDTEQSAVRIENAIGDKDNVLSKNTFHDCKSYCMYIDNAQKVNINKNVFYNGRLFHVRATAVRDYSFKDNLMIAATNRPTLNAKELVSCYATWDAIHENLVVIKDNLCQGSHMHGFVLPHIPCDYIDSPPYSENTAGSTDTAFIFNKIGGSCLAMTGVKAYASKLGQICSPAGPD